MEPVLWHIGISHYSEKARWALDYKGVRHERRAPVPGLHIPLAFWLTRGRAATLPILELDGRVISDSTAIIAALEHRHPDPALYPEDPADRARALALEDWFDRELGPYIRRVVFHEVGRDGASVSEIAAQATPELSARLGGTVVPYTRALTSLRYLAASERGAERARNRVLAALDRLEAELGGEEYLVGGRFTVADLTAAALLYPLALPSEGPRVIDRMPEAYETFRASVRDRPGYRWVEEMFRRHRRRSSEPAFQEGGSL